MRWLSTRFEFERRRSAPRAKEGDPCILFYPAKMSSRIIDAEPDAIYPVLRFDGKGVHYRPSVFYRTLHRKEKIIFKES